MVLILSDEDVGHCMAPETYIDASRFAFIAHEQGLTDVPSRIILDVNAKERDKGNSSSPVNNATVFKPTLFKPACLPSQVQSSQTAKDVGLKVVTRIKLMRRTIISYNNHDTTKSYLKFLSVDFNITNTATNIQGRVSETRQCD